MPAVTEQVQDAIKSPRNTALAAAAAAAAGGAATYAVRRALSHDDSEKSESGKSEPGKSDSGKSDSGKSGSGRSSSVSSSVKSGAGKSFGAAKETITRPLSNLSGAGRSGASSILSSAAASSWAAAAEVLIPMAEDAAESAGKYLAENGPDIVRDRIVPKFIEAFNEAR